MALKLLKPKDSHEFKPILVEIEEDPGSPLGPAMFWIIMILMGFFLIWAIFGEVDVVVAARGKVIPAGQVKLVQPLTGGVVSRILVKEGDFVKRGQSLVVVDPSTTEPALASSRETLAHVKLEQARLEASASHEAFQAATSEDGNTQTRLYEASLESLERQLNAKEKALENLDAQIQAKQVEVRHTKDMLKIHAEKEANLRDVRDIIARDTYEQATDDVLADEDRLKILSHELAQLDFQKQQTQEEMAYLEQNFKSGALTDLSEKQKQAAQLKANLREASFRNARQTLTAPVDGYVHELFIHTVGGVVTPAEKILSIVPAHTPLRIQATVLNKDIGFVRSSMPVAIKVDTFDFQKYGLLKGVVGWVDKDSRNDEKLGPVYTVEVIPQQHRLKVNGHWQALSSGMSVSAEVKTGKRRIIEFLIYPMLRNLNEGLSVR